MYGNLSVGDCISPGFGVVQVEHRLFQSSNLYRRHGFGVCHSGERAFWMASADDHVAGRGLVWRLVLSKGEESLEALHGALDAPGADGSSWLCGGLSLYGKNSRTVLGETFSQMDG